MRRVGVVLAVAAAQLSLVGMAVATQLSARSTGTDHLLEVRPLDPIDPFRGAYVTLDYPGLRAVHELASRGGSGDLYATLVEEDGYWVAGSVSRTRPAAGPYLACRDTGWAADCGIGSWFASQDDAAELERRLADEGGVATVRIDERGHATVVDVR